jgi:hypothetical protein
VIEQVECSFGAGEIDRPDLGNPAASFGGGRCADAQASVTNWSQSPPMEKRSGRLIAGAALYTKKWRSLCRRLVAQLR